MAQLEWNSVYAYVDEDWNAAMSSEVFRNYIKITQATEQRTKLMKESAVDAQKQLEDENDDKKKLEPVKSNLPYGDYQEHVKATQASYEDELLVKQALDELLGEQDNIDEIDNDVDIVEPSIDNKNNDYSFSQDENSDCYDVSGIGESKYIDVGITSETEKLLENGIDYQSDSLSYQKNDDAEMLTLEEIEAAEKFLGLNKNAFYILSQLSK